MLFNLLRKLWRDEIGGVICGEYVALGAMVFGATLVGGTYTRDRVIECYQGLGDSLVQATQQIAQQPQQPLQRPTGDTCLILCTGQLSQASSPAN